MVRVVVALIISMVLHSAVFAIEPRIALLITNQSYSQPGAALANTHRDGEILKAALEKAGFKVWVTQDAVNEGAMLRAIGDHVQRLTEAGPEAVGFFYYSGHGAADRANGENFLIPTGAPVARASDLPLMAVRLDRITSTLSTAGKMSIVVFDACRNVPLLRVEKNPFKGFVPVREQNGLLIAFATEPGNVAIDQNQYAKALAEELLKPNVEAAEVFRRVRQRVRADTQQAQSPEYVDRRDYGFQFVAVAPPPLASVPLPPDQPQLSEAERTWPWVKDTTSQVVLENFIKQFGETSYGAKARSRLDELRIVDDARAKADAERQRLALLQDTRKTNTSFDGLWDIDRDGAGCNFGARKQYRIRVEKGTVTGDTGTGPIRGTVSEIGKLTLTHTGIDKQKRASGKVTYTGTLTSDGGAGTFDKPGTTCRGTFMAKRIAALEGEPTKPSAPIGSTGPTALTPGRVFRDCLECPEMVVVPAGSFLMGSPAGEKGRESSEGPQHKVTISKSFGVGKFEVTFAEWDACLSDGACKHSPSDEGWGRGKRPVINVSWDDISNEFLPWLLRKTNKPYGLLTEAEWEYSARAGTMTAFSTGGAISTDQANFKGSFTAAKTIEVGSLKPNAFGLHDMDGNVREWVQDCYRGSYVNAPSDGSALDVQGCPRVLRGGYWGGGPRGLRAAARLGATPDHRDSSSGFRVARTLD